MGKERKRTILLSLLASACFSGGIALKPIAGAAPAVGVLLGTICMLAAVFFLEKTKVK